MVICQAVRQLTIYNMRYFMKALCFFIFFIITVSCFGQSEDWHARWIGIPFVAKDTNVWTSFRKDFFLNEMPLTAQAKIATDSKYWLWVNGKLVVFEGELKRGPNPRDTYFDQVDIAKYLERGKNTIAILTWYWGRDGFDHKSSGKPALLFQGSIGKEQLISDRSWKAVRNPAFGNTGAPVPNYRLPEFNVYFDARKAMPEWQEPDFVDSGWPNAEEYGVPPVSPWHNLVKRPIPLWKDEGLRDYTNQSSLPSTSDDKVIVAKLPKNITITPYLQIAGPAGLAIDIRTDNYKGGSEYNVRTEYITREGVQEFETPGYMNGHEVLYTIPAGIKIIALKYRETRYNTEQVGQFACNDSFYNKLWRKSYNTLNVNLRDAIQDPDRERAQWWGDAVILMGEILYACDSNGMPAIQKAMHNLVDWQKPNGVLYSPVPAGSWDRELPGQMLASIGKYGFWNYYRYTADTAMIRYVYPAVKKYLDLWQLGKDGLVVHRAGGWDWLDWGEDIDTVLIDNAWYYMALDAAAQMASLTGNQPDEKRYQAQMKSVKKNFNKRLWNGNAYKSPGNKGVMDDRGNGLAVVAGLVEPEKFDAVKKVLQNEFHASPYMEKYIMESFFIMNDAAGGLKRMKKRYANMVKSPLTTLWEGWGIGSEGYGGGSYNHGWSGGPLTLLSQYVAGIAPVAPGYETFSIMPQPGNLNEIHCITPTVKGNVTVDWKKEENTGMELSVSIPLNTTAIVGVPEMKSDLTKITVNGKLMVKDKKEVDELNGVKFSGVTGNYFLFQVKPGNWSFRLF